MDCTPFGEKVQIIVPSMRIGALESFAENLSVITLAMRMPKVQS